MPKQSIYFECNSGISGDMTVAALLDLGADEEKLRKVLASLPVDGYEVRVSRVKKSAIDACDFDVVLEEDNHDHDMEYLHGHEHHHEHEHDDEHHHHEHDHEHEHDDEHHHHEHCHEHEHDEHHHHEHHHEHGHDDGHHHHEHEHGEEHHHDHGHHHVHRGLPEINAIIDAGEMTDNARKLAHKIFRIIAEAEAKAHNTPVDQVHFHEVGAIDSIVDIVSAAVCLDDLHVDEVIIPSVTEGTGTVRSQHGILSIPVPAVTNIVAAEGLDLKISNIKGELVTPTGAAVAAAFRTSKELPAEFRIRRIGLGAGKRQYECPGILRAMLIEYDEKTTAQVSSDQIVRLETNIDDCTGEILGYTLERLMEAGARDAFYQPVFMKKNRPAWLLTVICKEDKREALEEIIFRETTTIGIRRSVMERTILEREILTVKTAYGDAQVKKCTTGSSVRFYPEYESAAALSRSAGVPLQDVYREIEKNMM